MVTGDLARPLPLPAVEDTVVGARVFRGTELSLCLLLPSCHPIANPKDKSEAMEDTREAKLAGQQDGGKRPRKRPSELLSAERQHSETPLGVTHLTVRVSQGEEEPEPLFV